MRRITHVVYVETCHLVLHEVTRDEFLVASDLNLRSLADARYRILLHMHGI